MLKEKPVSEVIEELGLPQNTEFVGYVLRLPESDEFLAEYNANMDAIGRLWAKTPDMAKVFSSFKKASKAKKHIEKEEAIVGWLFDMGDSYFVTSIDGHEG